MINSFYHQILYQLFMYQNIDETIVCLAKRTLTQQVKWYVCRCNADVHIWGNAVKINSCLYLSTSILRDIHKNIQGIEVKGQKIYIFNPKCQCAQNLYHITVYCVYTGIIIVPVSHYKFKLFLNDWKIETHPGVCPEENTAWQARRTNQIKYSISKSERFELRDKRKEVTKTDNQLKSLQSVGQIIGEVLKEITT